MCVCRVSFLLVLLCCAAGVVLPFHQGLREERNGGEQASHLPRDVTPLHYNLELHTLMDDSKYQGHVTIKIECQEESDKITLHAHPDLNVDTSNVKVMMVPKVVPSPVHTEPPHTEPPTVAPVPVGAARLVPVSSSFVPENACTSQAACNSAHSHNHHENESDEETSTATMEPTTSKTNEEQPQGKPVNIAKVERNIQKQWIVIHIDHHLQRGELYFVTLPFSGPLQPEPSNGIYVETYMDLATREKRSYVATHMQQENARKVFPCFDEPSYKVPMQITIVAPVQYSVLGNMEKEADTLRGDWVWHQFQTTPPMATFSVAFVVQEIPILATNDDSQIRLYGRAELRELQNTNKAIQAASQAVEYLSEYLATPKPLSKLDIVVLPGSHSSAESSWGLIFLRESHLTCQHCIIPQITRDVAYQWVGHLITPHSWDVVDINKALASFLAFGTELKIDNAISSSSRMWFMNYPLYYEFGKRAQYTQTAFLRHPHRAITYELVLRMFNYTFTEEAFRKGVQYLVNLRSQKTYQTSEVWLSLTLMAGAADSLPEPGTANQIANSWLSVPRVPYIKVTRDYDKHSAEVEQHSFYRDVLDDVSEPDDVLWWIPLVLVSQNNLKFDNLVPIMWMEEEKRVNLQDLPSSSYFIIVNPEEVGPFIVNYDRKNWFLISEYLDRNINNEQIPAGTRAKLIHDALNLAFGGKLRFDSALNVTRFLIHERDPIVWQPAFNLFDHIIRQIEGSKVAIRLQEYLQVILTPAYEALSKKTGILSASEERMLSSSRAILCASGYKPCISEARQSWKIWMLSDEPDAGIPINLSQFCWVFKFGTKEEWEFGLERFKRYPPHLKQADRYYLLKSLVSCPNDSWNVENLLNMTILGPASPDRDEDVRSLLASLSSQVGYTALFNLLEDNWDTVKSRYDTKESRLWENIVSTATMNFKTQDGHAMVTALYEQRKSDLGTATPIVEQALRRIERQVSWLSDNGMIIEQWLDNYLSKWRP